MVDLVCALNKRRIPDLSYGIIPPSIGGRMDDTDAGKTAQLKVGPGLIVKMIREFGFPTIVALALAGAFAWYAHTVQQDRAEFEQKVMTSLKKLKILVKSQKGCTIDESDVE